MGLSSVEGRVVAPGANVFTDPFYDRSWWTCHTMPQDGERGLVCGQDAGEGGHRGEVTVAPGGVVCLTGVGSGGRTVGLNTADVATNVVLRNNVVVGSVNANKRHWYRAGQVLAKADPPWLARLVTRREAPDRFARALERDPNDIKVVVQFAQA